MADNVWPAILSMMATRDAITDKFGSDPMRFFPIVLPAGLSTFPAATFRMISQVGNPTYDGASRYDFNNVEFHVYGKTALEVADAVETLRRELDYISGEFDQVQINNVRYIDSGSDDWNDNMNKFSKQIEFRVDHRRLN